MSGSFEHEHEEGTTRTLITRLVPHGMVLDPDGQMDVFTFSDGERNAHFVGTLTPDDAEGYITRNVVDRVPGWNGGTYSNVLHRNREHLGWAPCAEDHGTRAFLSRLLGASRNPTCIRKSARS